MPGFGTTGRTLENARALARAVSTTLSEIDIRAACLQHIKDIGLDPSDRQSTTFQNVQARERTQILMDIANKEGGFVVGTGDLSEAALGWMTFNGDHMSMYHVNAGVPKTLVRYLVEWTADAVFEGDVRHILHDIVDTPISPELLPLKDGKMAQHTEDTVGPYELLDFFLYHAIRSGSRPAKVLALARQAFDGDYDDGTILRWMEVFWRRFASQSYAPVSPTWGVNNRSVALRIPAGDIKARRIEHRPAGVDANPYLVAATVLAGVRKGLKEQIDPGPETTGNGYEDENGAEIPADWTSPDPGAPLS